MTPLAIAAFVIYTFGFLITVGLVGLYTATLRSTKPGPYLSMIAVTIPLCVVWPLVLLWVVPRLMKLQREPV